MYSLFYGFVLTLAFLSVIDSNIYLVKILYFDFLRQLMCFYLMSLSMTSCDI